MSSKELLQIFLSNLENLKQIPFYSKTKLFSARAESKKIYKIYLIYNNEEKIFS